MFPFSIKFPFPPDNKTSQNKTYEEITLSCEERAGRITLSCLLVFADTIFGKESALGHSASNESCIIFNQASS